MQYYIDMDDTVVGFKEACARRGVPDIGNGFHARPKSEWTLQEVKCDELVRALMVDPSFWTSLPILPHAHELIATCATRGATHILTAVPSGLESDEVEMIRGIKLAMARDLLHIPMDNIIICDRATKKAYAHDRAVLVDDNKHNIDEWTSNGGIGVHHVSGAGSILQIKTDYKKIRG